MSAEDDAREAVAAWMIAHSYATGHGDTLDDLLQELIAQAIERNAQEREAQVASPAPSPEA